MDGKATRFELIGDPTRMQILEQLGGNNRLRAKDILENLQISQPTLSHHMHILVDENIVTAEKSGRECYYSINDETIREMILSLRVLLSDVKVEKKDKKDKKKKKKKEKNK
ncbi:MAG: winged helix-turn-helix transcriptional regulator [Clostridiales bacterium]|nr:winged helix-turn-helix transcriptional regulator [Candidatus Scatonaster coprocaballi]